MLASLGIQKPNRAYFFPDPMVGALIHQRRFFDLAFVQIYSR